MALISRISRLFKADFHAVLDQIEEPEILLKQSIREMEDQLSDADSCLHSTLGEADQLTLRREEFERALRELEEQLDICFDSNQEDLIRELIKRQLQGQHSLKLLKTRQISVEKTLIQQRKSLQENHATLESLRQRAELFTDRSASAAGNQIADLNIPWGSAGYIVTEHDVEVALLREKQRRAKR